MIKDTFIEYLDKNDDSNHHIKIYYLLNINNIK